MRCSPKLAGLLAMAAVTWAAVAPAAGEETYDPWVEPTQPVWGKAFSLGFEPSVSMPLGDFGDVAGIGVGLSVRAEYQVHTHIRPYVRGGGVFHLIKNEINTYQVGGGAGVEVLVRPGNPELFWAEGGAAHYRFKVEPGIERIDPSTEPTAGFGAGYDAARFGVRLGVTFPSLTEIDTGVVFMAVLTVRAIGWGTAP